MLFNERAASLLGKAAEKLVKEYGRFDTPPEIRALVGEKMTVVVKVMPPKTASKSNDEPTFDIVNIKKRHGKELVDSAFDSDQEKPVLPSTSSYPPNLPPLAPIQLEKEEDQVPPNTSNINSYILQYISYIHPQFFRVLLLKCYHHMTFTSWKLIKQGLLHLYNLLLLLPSLYM
jgi:hypothetical protein